MFQPEQFTDSQARIRAHVLNALRIKEQPEGDVFRACAGYPWKWIDETIGLLLDARLIVSTLIDGSARGLGWLPGLRLAGPQEIPCHD